MAKEPDDKKEKRPFPLAALVLAWLVPGAGHVYIGRTVRGVIIFVSIAALFWTGIAVGGVMTVDREYERWWFAADMLTGVHGLSAWRMSERVYGQLDARLAGEGQYQQQMDAVRRRPRADQQAVRRPYILALLTKRELNLIEPAETIARAYAGVAGLLNLLCIFDAVVLALMGAGREPAPRRAGGQRRSDRGEQQ